MDSKLLVASEYTDPSFYTYDIIERLKEEKSKVGLLLITKDIEGILPVWDFTASNNIPTILHTTITSLGGTTLEPNVLPTAFNMFALRQVMKQIKEHQDVVLRIDPIIPNVTIFEDLEGIIEGARKLGILECRVSILDYYPFVRDKMTKAGYPVYSTFQAPKDVIDTCIAGVKYLCDTYGMNLSLCGEKFKNVHPKGCAWKDDWTKYDLDLPYAKFKQRKTCLCNVPKYDILKGRECKHGCLYCYWGKDR